LPKKNNVFIEINNVEKQMINSKTAENLKQLYKYKEIFQQYEDYARNEEIGKK